MENNRENQHNFSVTDVEIFFRTVCYKFLFLEFFLNKKLLEEAISIEFDFKNEFFLNIFIFVV